MCKKKEALGGWDFIQLGGREKCLKLQGKVLNFAHPEPRPSPLSTNVPEVTAGPKLAAGGEEELAEGVLVGTACPLSHSYWGSRSGLVCRMPEFTFLPLASPSQKKLAHPLCHPRSSSFQSCFCLSSYVASCEMPLLPRCQASKSCDWPRGIKGNMIPGQSHHASSSSVARYT